MTASRVASAHKPRPTIAEALGHAPELVRRAENAAQHLNQRPHLPAYEQDAQSILYTAIVLGLDEIERSTLVQLRKPEGNW